MICNKCKNIMDYKHSIKDYCCGNCGHIQSNQVNNSTHNCSGLKVLNNISYGKNVMGDNYSVSVTFNGTTMITIRHDKKINNLKVTEQEFLYCPFCGKELVESVDISSMYPNGI